MDALAWIENTAASVWFREALWAFPTLLVFHALGMAFLVGTSGAINLRLLGVVPNISLSQLSKFYPIIILAFIVNLISGLLLLLSYPAKGLTNPLFFIKIGVVVVAVILTQWQFNQFKQAHFITTPRIKYFAGLILILWVIGIFSGRLLAYTHTWLLVS
jgi:hypothetical protein